MSVQKLTNEELESLKESRSKSDNITLSLGQIEIQKAMLESQKGSILKELSELQETQNTLAKELQDKYGIGNIDLETGEFTTAE